VLPFENLLFVADRDGGLSVIDTATNKVLNRVALPLSGPVPPKITVVPATKRVYVTDFSGDRVLVIDGSTLSLISTVPTGQAPTAITSDAKANRIYVANLGLQSARVDQSVPGSVTVIDGGGSVLATVPTRGHPITLDVSPGIGTNRLYIGALGLPGEASFIQVIDTLTWTQVASVGVAAPSGLVADPVDNAVYAVTPFQAPRIGSKLIELDARTNVAAISVVDSPGDARAIGWHPGSDDRYRRIYVASQTDLGGILHVYRTLQGTIRLSEVGTVRVGAEPVAIAVDGSSHRVYVASAGAKTISVVLQGPG
jgi:YVTN family beta-propeller protein